MGDHDTPHEGPSRWCTTKVSNADVETTKYLWNFVLRVKSAPFDEWISQSSTWFPNECEDESGELVAYRVRGRPYSKWDDDVGKCYREYYQKSWQNMPLDIFRRSSKNFIDYFCHLCSPCYARS